MADTHTRDTPAEPPALLDGEAAQAIADRFLIMQMGDLLMARNPRLTSDGRWLMDVTLSNTVRGELGAVGTIAIEARSGAVFFSEADRAQVIARADELSNASPL